MKSEEVYKELLRIAKQDQVLTEDEDALIKNIMENIDQYYKILDDANQDAVISDDEKASLQDQRGTILADATKIARNDETVSVEEFNLLMGLRRILAGLGIKESE